MRGGIRCVRALLHVATLEWWQPHCPPPDGRAQGIRSPLYRRYGQKARRGDHPHTPRRGDAIEARNPTAAHDAMYLHLVYNRNMIAEGA